MKILLPIATISLAFTLFISSCGKDDNPAPAKTNTELLTQNTWRFSTATASGIDISSQIPTCQKDNVYTFTTAGTGTADEGATKCNAGDPQSNPFTWNFASMESVLHISTTLFTGGSNDLNIVTLSETQLVLSQTLAPFGTIIVTLVH
jgi:hypothetical protein